MLKRLLSLFHIQGTGKMPSIGSVAPAFEVQDQDGRLVKLSDFKGKRVVLWFYPKADTPG